MDIKNKIDLFLKYDKIQKKVKAITIWDEKSYKLNNEKKALREQLYTSFFVNYLNSCRVGQVIEERGDYQIIIGKTHNSKHKILLLRKKPYECKKSTLQHFYTFDEIESSLGTDKCALTYYCEQLDKLNEIETQLELLKTVKQYVIEKHIEVHGNYRIKITKAPNGYKVRLV